MDLPTTTPKSMFSQEGVKKGTADTTSDNTAGLTNASTSADSGESSNNHSGNNSTKSANSSISISKGSSDQNEDPEVVKLQNYLAWKHNTPLLYDALLAHHCQWPALAMQWGSFVEATGPDLAASSDAYGQKFFKKQKLFFSRQTDGVYNDVTKCWSGVCTI